MSDRFSPWSHQKWPKYDSHDKVRCFNCDAVLHLAHKPSGSPDGSGQFEKFCTDCRMSTWYDIKHPDGAHK